MIREDLTGKRIEKKESKLEKIKQIWKLLKEIIFGLEC